MDPRPQSSRHAASSGSSPDKPRWRRFVRPEIACLVLGMGAALFLGWTLQPHSAWEALVRASALWLGPGAAAFLSELPDLVGVAALLAVVYGASRVVTSAPKR